MTPADIRYLDDLLVEIIKSLHSLEGLVTVFGLLICGLLVLIWHEISHDNQTIEE